MSTSTDQTEDRHITLTLQSDREGAEPEQRTIALSTSSGNVTWDDELTFKSKETWTTIWSDAVIVNGGFVSSKPGDPDYSKRGRVCGNGYAEGNTSQWYTTVKNQSSEKKLKGYFWVMTG